MSAENEIWCSYSEPVRFNTNFHIEIARINVIIKAYNTVFILFQTIVENDPLRKLRDIGKKGQRDEIVSIGAMVIEKENEMSKNKSQGLIWDRLKTYYNEKGISAREFKCDCYEDCLKSCHDKDEFIEAREPYIGKNYENASVPRLLFMSLDPGDPGGAAKDDWEKRTMEYLRENTSYIKNIDKRKNDHWYRTHQFAWIIFDEWNNQLGLGLDIGRTDERMFFEPREEIKKIRSYFAHTNSAKCCENKTDSSQANKTLFKNCRGYIAEEIQIFKPHILVTQGNQARNAIENAFKPEETKNISENSRPDLMMMEFNEGTPSLWIHHYHPRSGKYFKNNRVKFEVYAKEAAKFINKYYPEFLASR